MAPEEKVSDLQMHFWLSSACTNWPIQEGQQLVQASQPKIQRWNLYYSRTPWFEHIISNWDCYSGRLYNLWDVGPTYRCRSPGVGLEVRSTSSYSLSFCFWVSYSHAPPLIIKPALKPFLSQWTYKCNVSQLKPFLP